MDDETESRMNVSSLFKQGQTSSVPENKNCLQLKLLNAANSEISNAGRNYALEKVEK